VDSHGCARRQLDVDLDGVCNVRLPTLDGEASASQWCSGLDNCPFVNNPLQTVTVPGAKVGDACNPGALARAL
jgi:hypothetical protein